MSDKVYTILIVKSNNNIILDIQHILLSHKNYITEVAHSAVGLITSVKKIIPGLVIYPLLMEDSKINLDSLIYFQNKFKFRIIFIAGDMELKYYKNKVKSALIFFLKKTL
ncbi:MAG: hypothetical protein A2V93_08055 [Ignavibacteria bacterium RBG_16_34_14]|nr:MAG: hypothetical protein A2V93_08055 [Ignavibacteria bacterium RBG_16_34_14]